MQKYITKLGEDNNVFKDEIGYIHHYDFSKANMNIDARIQAITTVASICYDNPNAVGRESLYNRLKAEAMGLPSSSFEFVPVLLTTERFQEIVFAGVTYNHMVDTTDFILSIEKYGEWIDHEGEKYLLTNYRALLADSELLNKYIDDGINIADMFNTEDECKIIKQNVKTFLYKFDVVTAQQHNRHRIALQGLSRRYVSGKKTEFEFYISGRMKDIKTSWQDNVIATNEIHEICLAHYSAAIKAGVKSQEARRILPQTMYTIIWSSFLPFQLKNYLALRDDLHAQDEIRWMAQAMKKFLEEESNDTND